MKEYRVFLLLLLLLLLLFLLLLPFRVFVFYMRIQVVRPSVGFFTNSAAMHVDFSTTASEMIQSPIDIAFYNSYFTHQRVQAT